MNSWCFVLLCASVWTSIMGCSDLHLERQTVAQRAKDAHIIVFAEAIEKYVQLSKRENHVYTTEFRLKCVLKNREQFFSNLEETSSKTDRGYVFNVTEMGFASGWCLKVDADINQNYYVFLQVDDKPNTFGLDQINAQIPIFPLSEEHTSDFEEYLHDNECVDSTTQTQTTTPEATIAPKTTIDDKLAEVESTTETSTTAKRPLTKLSRAEYFAKPQVSVTDEPLSLLASTTTTTTGNSSRLQSRHWLWIVLETWLLAFWVRHQIA